MFLIWATLNFILFALDKMFVCLLTYKFYFKCASATHLAKKKRKERKGLSFMNYKQKLLNLVWNILMQYAIVIRQLQQKPSQIRSKRESSYILSFFFCFFAKSNKKVNLNSVRSATLFYIIIIKVEEVEV